MLSIKNLSLTFLGQKSEAFHNVNLEVKESEVLLLTGNSGIGKSALLMCIAGVIPETFEGNISGEIDFQGESLIAKKPCDISGDIAYMFQDSDSQLCTFTVEDEIAFGLENLLMEPEIMRVKVDEVLAIMGISHLKKCRINELSGGEKQKVAFASIIAMGPKLILMDEPTANLDPCSTRELVTLIKKLNSENGTTFVIVEHKIDEFLHVVTRVQKMRQSGIEEISKENIFKEYLSYKEKLANDVWDIGHSDLPENIAEKRNPLEILRLDRVWFAYGRNEPCLKDLSLSVKEGQMLAIAGANGTGKSTLSKLIMGLLIPSKGEVRIGGKRLREYKMNELGKSVGYVFQNPEHQFIKESVENELAISLKIAGHTKEVIAMQVEDYLSKFSLGDQRKANPFMLSQGQKRRLSTASMLINGQSLLILDEPTYGQDRENLLSLVHLLREVNRKGVTVIMITHDLLLMEYVTDKVAILQNGRMAYTGPFDMDIVQELLIKKV